MKTMENKKDNNKNGLRSRSNLAHLFWINILYANPMMSGNISTKKNFEDKKRVLGPYILRNYIIGTLAILIIYSSLFIFLNFNLMPAMLDIFLAFIIAMNLINNFTTFFNVFYESKDAESYMSLPISQKTIFMAKLGVVGIVSTQLSAMVIPLFIVYFYQMGFNIAVAFVFGILNFLLVSAFTICLNIALMLLLAKTSLLTRMKTKIIVVLTMIAMIANVAMIFAIQSFMRSSLENTIFLGIISELPISGLLKTPLGELIFIGIALVTVAIVYLILSRIGIKGLYNNIRAIQQRRFDNRDEKARLKDEKTRAKSSINTKENKPRTPFKIMVRHNLSLLKNGTLLAQLLVPILMPAIIVATQINNLSQPAVMGLLYTHAYSFMMIMGVLIAVIGNAGNSISAIFVSLDGEMYDYIMSLPISRRAYVKVKVLTAGTIQGILPPILLIVLGVIVGMEPFAMLAGIAVFLVTNFALASLWTMYDYRHVLTNWQSVNQLFTKVGKVVPAIIIVLGMFSLVGLFTLYTIWNIDETMFHGGIAIAVLVLAIFAKIKYSSFKKKLLD